MSNKSTLYMIYFLLFHSFISKLYSNIFSSECSCIIFFCGSWGSRSHFKFNLGDNGEELEGLAEMTKDNVGKGDEH